MNKFKFLPPSGYLSRTLGKLFKLKKDNIYIPELVKSFEAEKILVLAPHFDDEVLGCGGSIYNCIKRGAQVKVVYLTDGGRGIPELNDISEINSIRKKESKEALNMLGVKEMFFLNEEDGSNNLKQKSITELSKIITDFSPELILVPWFLDNHTDHLKFNEVLKQSFKFSGHFCLIAGYEVWSPLVPNVLVDITDCIEIKKEATKCFKSQLKQVNYLRTIIGLNRYRSIYNLQGNGYCEAFLVLGSKEYFKLF